MGIDTICKRWLLNRYPTAWLQPIVPPEVKEDWENHNGIMIRKQKKGEPISNSLYLYRNCNVMMLDYTFKLKYIHGGSVFNSNMFITNHILPDITQFYRSGGEYVYMNFDRKSPINKDKEHEKRYKDLKLNDVEEDIKNNPDKYKFDDNHIPADWKTFANCNYGKRTIMNTIYTKIFSPNNTQNRIYNVPNGKKLFCFGALTNDGRDDLIHCNVSIPIIKEGAVSASGYEHIVKPCHSEFPSHEIENISEAEMACFYLMMPHIGSNKNNDVIIVTTDGDVLLVSLLNSHLRYDKERDVFKNKVIVRLKLPTDNGYQDVDINSLYKQIITDPIFSRYTDPITTVVSALLLIKNDYIMDYGKGMKKLSVVDLGLNDAPFTIVTLCRWPDLFKDMIKIKNIHELFMKTSIKNTEQALIELDENLFITFTKMCYVSYYGKTWHDGSLKGEEERIRNMLRLRKNKCNRMMVKRECRVNSRNLLWVLNYWMNNYIGNCKIPSPISTYRDFPYFGWEYDFEHNMTVKSTRVSVSLGSSRMEKKMMSFNRCTKDDWTIIYTQDFREEMNKQNENKKKRVMMTMKNEEKRKLKKRRINRLSRTNLNDFFSASCNVSM